MFLAALADTIAGGGTNAEESFEVDGKKVSRDPSVSVAGSWDGGSGILAALRSA